MRTARSVGLRQSPSGPGSPAGISGPDAGAGHTTRGDAVRSACKSSHAVDFCLVFPIRGGLSRAILESIFFFHPKGRWLQSGGVRSCGLPSAAVPSARCLRVNVVSTRQAAGAWGVARA